MLAIVIPANAGPSFGLQTNLVSDQESGGFPLLAASQPAPIYLDPADWPGVLRAGADLQADVERVTGLKPLFATTGSPAGKFAVIIGTLGKSPLLDGLVKAGKLNADAISGKWESFIITTVANPLPGMDQALVIAGSDKRGTIYGIYEISEQIGVSPWYWWADVPAKHHDHLFIKAGTYVQGSPSVKYRGIFLNDEAPDLSNWIREKYGTVPGRPGTANYGHQFYTNIFEVILRLRGNYLWPAMWNNAFNEDDTNNPVLADMYGVVMGNSHQEPMMRSQQEWDRKYSRQYGSWNYATIPNVVSNFWRDGITRNKDYENLITIGLRGANDTPMASGGPEVNRSLLEKIVADQRSILADVVNPDVTKVPQVWCLYKEVMDYYNAGMRVPDDVTLLWAEDNWGNVRRLPTAEERKRGGGAGIYYHFDYHGGPRSYQWLNTTPISKIYDQMSLAKQYGADRVWIVNVGHFKGYELPLQYFMSLAWNSDRWKYDNLDEFTQMWAEQQFGSENAGDIADILNKYTKYNGRRKPELLEPGTYSLVNYQEAETVVADFKAITAKAETIYSQLPEASRDAFYQLVLFPTKASALVNELYLAAGKNALFAKQGRASANDYAVETRALFQADTNLMAYYNRTFAGGKWNHFMDQSHLGYTSWQDPPQNNLNAISLAERRAADTNAVAEVTTPQAGRGRGRGRGGAGGGTARNTVLPDLPAESVMGVAVEGSTVAVTNGEMTLPQFDSFNQQKHYVYIFDKGKTAFEFTATASEPWIVMIYIESISVTTNRQLKANGLQMGTNINAKIENDQQLLIIVDWNKAPKGSANGTIKITGAGGEVAVNVNTFNPTEVTRDSLQGFVEGEGFVSIEPEHFTKKTDAGQNRWQIIQNYGRTLSGMLATQPVDAPSATPGKNSPCLEYKMYMFNVKTTEVAAVTSPVLNFNPDRGVRYAVSFDDEVPQVVTLVPKNYNAQNGNRDWEESVKANSRIGKSTHTLKAPGYHTLKFWMIDPGVVLQKIVVNTGGVKPSYLGPPESFYRQNKSDIQINKPEKALK